MQARMHCSMHACMHTYTQTHTSNAYIHANTPVVIVRHNTNIPDAKGGQDLSARMEFNLLFAIRRHFDCHCSTPNRASKRQKVSESRPNERARERARASERTRERESERVT